MPKISIIVPVYNVEKYLAECLESILVQTLKDIEVICIDDGSTDDSYNILDRYAKKDNRIKVIHKSNSGYGQTMNLGLNIAAGEYIGIVESDDYILPEMYENLYRYAHLNQLDIVKSDCIFWWPEIGYEYRVHVKNVDEYYNRVLSEKEREIFFKFWMNNWTGIYRKSFLDEYQIRHNESAGASYQDNGFWIQAMSFARNLMCLDKAYYFYRQDNFNASVKSVDKAMCMTEEYDFAAEILKNAGKIKELEICNSYRLSRNRGTFYRISDSLKKDFCKQITEDYGLYGNVLYRNEFLKQWYQNICQNTNAFCEEVIQTKQEVIDRLSFKDNILIYGAGVRGQRILRLLLNMGYQDRIEGFVISTKPSEKEIGPFKVYGIDELDMDVNKIVLIVSVSNSSEAYEEIVPLAKKNGFTDILDGDLLLKNFYLIC